MDRSVCACMCGIDVRPLKSCQEEGRGRPGPQDPGQTNSITRSYRLLPTSHTLLPGALPLLFAHTHVCTNLSACLLIYEMRPNLKDMRGGREGVGSWERKGRGRGGRVGGFEVESERWAWEAGAK